MRDENNGSPLLHQTIEKIENLLAGFAIKRTGGLIRQQDQRIIDHSPRDAHALLLPA